MAHYRTSPAERARRELALLRTGFGVAMAILFAFGLTGAANGPAPAEAAVAVAEIAAPTQPAAKLSRNGDEVLITGSIGHIFDTAAFTGPNRALKRDRARPMADAVAISRDFEGIRARLAALRTPKVTAPVVQPMPPELPAAPGETAGPAMPEGRIELASISPDFASDALDAIDDAASAGTVSDAPIPLTLDAKLAYARADLPATVFDGKLRDTHGKEVSEKELWCMATAIYFESRGESYRGQVAVGQVVMNRVAHRLYPSTICGVVFQNQNKRNACQFSFACDGIPERVTEPAAWKQAMQIAKDVIAGKEYLTEVGYSTHYHATYVYPHWAPRMKKNVKIGMHVFYQFKRGWKFG